jgi:ceramide glucosyltransferase
MTLVLCILLTLGAVALAIQVLGQLAVFWLVGRRHNGPTAHAWGVSVLKPLKGVDPALETNLRSLFQQDWLKLQLVFGAADPADPALFVVRRLARQYPEVDIRIVTSPATLGLNPKVNLCAKLAAHARYDLQVISDASVLAPKDYVRAMVQSFSRPNTGLVSSPLVGFGESTAGGAVDNLVVNLLILRAVCFTNLFARHACVIGKSMMFRHSELRRLGGFQQVADVLAEDYVLGRLFRRAGFAVRLCPRRLPTRTNCSALRHSVQRHLRWCQMRRRTSALAYAAELLSNVSVWAVALVVLAWVAPVPSRVFWASGLLFIAAKCVIDALSILWLSPRAASWSLIRWLPAADLINLWVWLQGAVKRRVEWRGTRLFIGEQTRLSPLLTVPAHEPPPTYSTAHL